MYDIRLTLHDTWRLIDSFDHSVIWEYHGKTEVAKEAKRSNSEHHTDHDHEPINNGP